MLNRSKLVLASSSPRRRMLINLLDVDFSFESPNIYERPPEIGENPLEYCAELAFLKTSEVKKNIDDNRFVLGVDTIVVLDDRIMGKPINAEHAVEMLKLLRGIRHSVYTAMALTSGINCRVVTQVTSTKVWMRNYSDEEIFTYVSSGDCMDKAGAYAIQDSEFSPVNKIDGCYMSVVGLPICDLIQLLNSTGLLGKVGLKMMSEDFDQCTYCPLSESIC